MPGRTYGLGSIALVIALGVFACAKNNEPPPAPAAKPAAATIHIRPTVEPIVEEAAPAAIEAAETEMPVDVVERPRTHHRGHRVASRPEQLDDVVTPSLGVPAAAAAPAPEPAAAPQTVAAAAAPAADDDEAVDVDDKATESEPRTLMLSDELLGDL